MGSKLPNKDFLNNLGTLVLMAFVHSQALKIEDIGTMIRQRRKDMGISLETLEASSGISRKTLTKLEKGGDVKYSTLTTVLGLLGLHLTFKTPAPCLKDDNEDDEWV